MEDDGFGFVGCFVLWWVGGLGFVLCWLAKKMLVAMRGVAGVSDTQDSFSYVDLDLVPRVQ